MAKSTGIIWTKSTFGAWIGCSQVSPACDHCYAKAMFDDRLHKAKWGPGMPRVRTSPAHWKEPLKWNREAPDSEFAGRKGFWPVFVNSASDVFDNEVDPQWRADLFSLIRATPNLTWLLLTKRIGNAKEMINEAIRAMPMMAGEEPFMPPFMPDSRYLFNFWLGATVVNQAEADRDIPKLLAVTAAKRFLSIEPMLGAIDLHPALIAPIAGGSQHGLRFIDWVIAGGESGPGARPMHPDWVRSLRDQCAAAGVPFLFKQWGEYEIASTANGHYDPDMATNPAMWVHYDGKTTKPSYARDDCYEIGHAWAMIKVGTKKSGNHLDNRQHLEFPA